MKKLIALAAVATLAACGEKAAETPAPAETVAAEVAPATGTAPGTYTVTDATGKERGTTTINADGTYSDSMLDGTTETGTFVFKNGQDCFTPAGGKPEECWNLTAPGADGSFTATSLDGKTVLTIKPATATATTTTAPAPAAAAPTPAAT